jgi:hypothetical protein
MTETIHLSEWDTLLRFHVEISKVKDDERLLVLSTHGFHELLINTLIEAKCKHGILITSDSRGYTQSIKLVILHKLGLIEDDLFQILDWFRRLRIRWLMSRSSK